MAKRGPGIRAAAEIKDWAILLYLVADHDGDDLDDSLIEELKTIIAAAKSILPSAHVAYQVDLKDTDGVFRHRIDGTERAADKPPLPKVKEETFAASPNNLREFFKWSKEECPARHHAVFFWGHSAGPAGLFPMFIAANPDFGPALRLDALAVAAAGPPSVFDHAGPALRALFADRLEQEIMLDRVDPADPLRLFSLKNEIKSAFGTVDLVAFKDCWMSTLETAFEIADSTDRMVASQSLLPIGRLYANFMWPYSDLLQALAAAPFPVDTPNLATAMTNLAEAMMNLIVQFYVDHFAEVLYLRSIPVTLLDLSKVSGLKSPMSALVAKLVNLPAAERRPLMEPARLVVLDSTNPFDPILLAGDGALLDILKLCAALKSVSWPAQGSLPAQTAAQQAVLDVETELRKLVKLNKEAQPVGAVPLGFQGVSALHWPPVGVATDDYITAAVRISVSAYKNLELVKQTSWDRLGLEHKP